VANEARDTLFFSNASNHPDQHWETAVPPCWINENNLGSKPRGEILSVTLKLVQKLGKPCPGQLMIQPLLDDTQPDEDAPRHS
jgi:hypothetical protein